MADVVRVKNVGDKPFKGMWDGQEYRFAPGEENIVPFDGACLWLGNPTSVGPARVLENARLRAKWGAVGDADKTAEQRWEENHPRLKVTTMTGEDVLMVIDDPDGEHVAPSVRTENEQKLLEGQVSELKRELQAVQGQLASVQRGETQDDDTPEDSPKKVPTGRGS